MKTSKRPPNTSIYNTTYFDYKGTYLKLKKSADIGALEQSDKGHITCELKHPEVFVEISPGGKVSIYYHRYNDRNEAVNVLKRLVVCHSFSIEQDLPRKLEAVQDGIVGSLSNQFTEPELPLRLEFARYIDSTTSPKTFEALTEGLLEYFKTAEKIEKAAEKIENTTDWIVTFGMTITEEIFPRLDYVETCDRLTKELTSTLDKSPYDFRLYEDYRDGEVLSLRYRFVWYPADGPLEFPQFPYAEIWERLELAPFKEIYPE